MAISVKNHEDRIVALENKIVSSAYSQTTLWTGKSWDNGFTITLSQSYKNFDMILLTAKVAYETYNDFKLYPVNLINIGTIYCHVNADLGSIIFKSETSITFPDQEDIAITGVYGIKFSNVILYYVSNIIYIKFKLRLNSAITIFLSHFLKFITGGETWKWL